CAPGFDGGGPAVVGRNQMPGWCAGRPQSTVVRATIDCVHPPYAAYLRVYEPLAAFDETERGRWQRYAARRLAPDARTGPAVERDAGLASLLQVQPRVPAEKDMPEHAFVLDVDGAPLVCPWRTAVRCWSAATELPDLMPGELAL